MPKGTGNESPGKQEMRKMMKDYLKNNDVKDGTDVDTVMRDMMSVLPKEVPDEEPGYSRHDYGNKDTDNSRNGHSVKTMHTSYGDMDVAIPVIYRLHDIPDVLNIQCGDCPCIRQEHKNV